MNAASASEQFSVYWPRGPRQTTLKPLAPRLPTLEGRTIAQLWDYLFFGDVVFELLEQGLKARFPGVRFVDWRSFGNVHGDDERAILAGLPARLRELGVDGVICGMAC